MLWFWVMRLMSIFGIVFVLKQISLMERLQRKKYIGVCQRWQPRWWASFLAQWPDICRGTDWRQAAGAGDHQSAQGEEILKPLKLNGF